MKKTSRIISFIMLLGIIIISVFVYFSYSKILKDSTRSISELTTMNVYSKIHNELTKPIYVSLTMANDSFLESWLDNETTANRSDLTNYLEQIKTKYGYNSTFLVSSLTKNYYHYDGILKTVSEDNDHDVWYYSFLENPETYELDVDVDEATGILTIFVNVKMYDEFNNVRAVVGVGLEMEFIQAIMQDFEQNYDLSIYLINSNGLVESSSNTDDIETLNVFTDLTYNDYKNQIINNKIDLVTISEHNMKGYIISRYINEIDWYILVEKETKIFSRFSLNYFMVSLIIISISIFAVSKIVNRVIDDYRKKESLLANQDYLTLLLNRRGFINEFNKLTKGSHTQGVLFMADIDNFKRINDVYGHKKGDQIIQLIANIVHKTVGDIGEVSRWGGDELAGFLLGDSKNIVDKLEEIRSKIINDKILNKFHISLSIGYTYLDLKSSIDDILIKADKALYLTKSKGGNGVEFEK